MEQTQLKLLGPTLVEKVREELRNHWQRDRTTIICLKLVARELGRVRGFSEEEGIQFCGFNGLL